MPDAIEPGGGLRVTIWTKTLPSRGHPERDEDLAWSAPNGVAHAVIDGMGGSRRVVEGREIGGEHAAAAIGQVLAERLKDLPVGLGADEARQLVSVAVAEAGERIFTQLNASGQIPADQIPPGSTAEQVMVAAVMTSLILCDAGRLAVTGQNGDTRAYLFSDGELLLITEDQDAVQLDVSEGRLTEEQADNIQEELDSFDGIDVAQLDAVARPYFAQRNLVFGQIGDAPAPRQPDFATIELRSGDMLLLCSDGVYANLTTAEISNGMMAVDPAAALVDKSDAMSALPNLPDPANASAPYNYRAHQDDITAIVIKVEW